MKSIWKFAIQIKDVQTITMPEGSRIRQVGTDPNGIVCLWAEVDTDARLVPLTVMVIGTGQELPDASSYLGTAKQGSFMWHIYGKQP